MLSTLDGVLKQAGWLGLAALFGASALEYLFPPFPGDTAVIFGGVYAVRAGWPVALVFLVLMAGSLAGASLDYFVGRWIGRRIAAAPQQRRFLRFFTREQVLSWEARFRHRGTLWLALNRFLPGVRGPIFLAAGVSQIPFGRVLFWGGLSSLVWNALLFAAGVAVGAQAERLQALVRLNARIAWTILTAIALILAARWAWGLWRARRVAPARQG